MKKSFLLLVCAALGTLSLDAAADDALSGSFSISPTKTVRFSRGNLRCAINGTDTVFFFHEHQYDIVGTDNLKSDKPVICLAPNNTYNKQGVGILGDTIDLFGWSSDAPTAHWGVDTATTSTNYTGNFRDWGKKIGDGVSFRTLSREEWNYIISGRSYAASKWGLARITLTDSTWINGLILLPNTWNCPEGISFNSNSFDQTCYTVDCFANYNLFTLEQWELMEQAGAVFLPSAGIRIGGETVGSIQGGTNYWSKDKFNSLSNSQIYCLLIRTNKALQTDIKVRTNGNPVRLVQVPTITITTTCEHGTILGGGVYEKPDGGTLETTLIAVPDYGYHFIGWSNGSTQDTLNITAYTDRTYRANFAPNSYTISVVSNDSAAGTVTGSGTFDFDTEQIISASANAPYHFLQWSDGNTDNPRTIRITQDSTYTALFGLETETRLPFSDTPVATKIWKDGQLYILRGNQLYTIVGQKTE